MSTNGEQTRNESYQSEQPSFPSRRAAVLKWVQDKGSYGATNEEIASGLGWEIHCVTGRVKELVESDELHEADVRRIGRSGKSHRVVVAKEHHATRSEPRSEGANGKADRGDSSGDLGQPQGNEAHRSGGDVRGQRVDRPGHSITAQLAALKTKPAEQQLNLF